MDGLQSSTPYDLDVNIWRDEQPGDDPVLHVAVQLAPRAGAAVWTGLRLTGFKVKTDKVEWRPTDSSIEGLSDGVYRVRAEGAPTIEEGADVTVEIELVTNQGSKQIVIGKGPVGKAE